MPDRTSSRPPEANGIVEVVETSQGAFVVHVGEETFEVFRLEDGTLTDGNLLPGEVVEIESPRAKLTRTHFGGLIGGNGRSSSTGRMTIKSPMPGLVRSVGVAIGDIVDRETTVLVLEAMKMENNIVAGVSGRVSALFAQPGTTVEKNSHLIEIERLP